MATVYKAYDTRLGRYVALKVMRPAAGPQPTLLRRFELEARSLASLNHPAVVRVLDYGEEDGWPYLVLEYIPSGTLKDWLNSGPGGASRPVQWKEAARFLSPIARALEAAHQRGIMHRDVKPSNILITEDGKPMLSDFGIAKSLESEATVDLTGTGLRLGTPEYMSPEQCTGAAVDARTDIYSLGIVFYEMVTGHKPFAADSPMATMHKQVYDPLPSPRTYRPDLPKSVEKALYRALAKDPNDRYQSMGEFAAVLEGLAGDAKAQAGAARPGGRRKFPGRMAAALLVFIVALVLAGSAFALARPLLGRVFQGGIPRLPTSGSNSGASTTGWQQGRLAFSQRQGGADGLFLLDLKGDLQPRLLYGAEGKHAFGADWSPDGRSLAYYIFPFDLRVVDVSSEQPSQKLGACHSPAWSPDGTRIMCVTNNSQLHLVDVNNPDKAPALKKITGIVPSWSPTRNEVAYSTLSKNKQDSTVWRLNLDSGDTVSLDNTGGENFAPSWSPDGNQIAYQSNEDSSGSEIWVMGRGGENPRRITHSPQDSWSRGPSWSPDGQWLSFVSNQAGSIGADYGEIFVVSLKTGEVIQVTHTGGQVYDWRVTWTK